jgi:RNA polymerase sigma-70 factor (ECF subfamily)
MQIEKQEQFKTLFEQYYTLLSRYAASIIGNYGIAEEVVQDVFVAIWHKRESLEFNSQLAPYLYTSVRNKCLNHLSKEKKSIPLSEQALGDSKGIQNPQQKMEFIELQVKIFRAIDELPPRCREIFLLSRMEHLTNKQIAEKLDISIKTVENQMTIALRKLTDAIGVITDSTTGKITGLLSILLLTLPFWG